MNAQLLRKLRRHEEILRSLMNLDYLTREQLSKLHDLGGVRNSQRILTDMSDYISCFRWDTGQNVYHLNKEGRERIGAFVVRNRTTQAGHYLMRNDAYIHFKPETWKNEARIGAGDLVFICDARFKSGGRIHFLEVDHLQRMHKNKAKIDRYKKLQATGAFQERFKYFPRLVWVTLTECRKRTLMEWCEGLDAAVYVHEEIK